MNKTKCKNKMSVLAGEKVLQKSAALGNRFKQQLKYLFFLIFTDPV